MPIFTKCVFRSPLQQEREGGNDPVNLSLCTTIKKGKVDNCRGSYFPSIYFVGCDVQWVFDLEIVRDAEFERVLSI